MLECSCHIISYLADVMNALRQSSGQGNSAVLMEGEEKAMEVDSDWVEELVVEEDDSQAEDSVRSCSFIVIHRAVFSKYVSVSVCMDLQTYISAVFGLSFYLSVCYMKQSFLTCISLFDRMKTHFATNFALSPSLRRNS